jgi:hypothetical protein
VAQPPEQQRIKQAINATFSHGFSTIGHHLTIIKPSKTV